MTQTDAFDFGLTQTMQENIVASLITTTGFSDCEICHAIWSRLWGFSRTRTDYSIYIGSFEDALSIECTRHKPIIEWFQRLCTKSPGVTPLGLEQVQKDVGISVSRPGILSLTESIQHGGFNADLLLIHREFGQDHPGIARVLDPKWIDTSVVEHWRKRCTSTHGASCENPLKIWSVRPAWVVDTEDMCLVPGKECKSYVALSYRWGKARGLKFQPDTIAKLQIKNGLNDLAISSQLAPIVQHAMSFTSTIGERYLWVDVLCIDHSRLSESTSQLQLMGAIYANASLTIVNLGGDAEDGLLGLEGTSRGRVVPSKLIPFGEENFIEVDDSHDYFGLVSWDPYHERGWTYQEFNMASRRLIFSEGSLHWMCQCSVWEEQLLLGIEAERYINPRIGEIMRGMPNLISLGNLIGKYNERELTYDEDALPGISGLLTIFSRCFLGGFICGIPEMFFEAALSWRPHWDHTNLRRRVSSESPNPGQLRPCILPSWSWIGWEGLVDIARQEAGPANPRASWIKETIPITTWYACDSPSTPQKRKIRSSWFETRELYKDFEKPLPTGWTRLEISETANAGEGKGGVLLHPDGCDSYIFRHENMADDTGDEDPWYWPFPVPDIQVSTQPFMPEQTPYLCCNTRRARVFAFQSDEGNNATLYSGKDKVIGNLRLHNEEQLQCFPPLGNGWAGAVDVELVAICRIRYYSKPFDEHLRLYEGPIKTREAYTVLWVEWINGIAYRLAIGEVRKADWEALGLEDVHLVLG